MNSNSYLSLSFHPGVLEAADAASHAFGAGPGRGAIHRRDVRAARRARGAHRPLRRPAGSPRRSTRPTPRCSAWRSRCRARTRSGSVTRSITTASSGRCASPTCRPRSARSSSTTTSPISSSISRRCPTAPAASSSSSTASSRCAATTRRSAEIAAVVARHEARFRDGIVTIMDDSHGIAAYGATGRGTEEHCGARVDIFIGTFGKAFGVNGGFVAGSADPDRGGPSEGGHLHLHEPARRGRLRRRRRGGRHRRRRRRTRAAGQPEGAHAPVPRRAAVARLRVDRRTAPGRAAARARHRSHARAWCAASSTAASSPSA